MTVELPEDGIIVELPDKVRIEYVCLLCERTVKPIFFTVDIVIHRKVKKVIPCGCKKLHSDHREDGKMIRTRIV